MSRDLAFLRRPDGDPRIGTDFGYHIENEKFVAFLEQHAAKIGLEVRDDTVVKVERFEQGIGSIHLASGSVATADLYVDCSGFRSLLVGETLGEPFTSFKHTLFCDRAVAGGWDRGGEPIKPYTTVETMQAGWCWQIEHEHRIIRGYVYSSDFISDEVAERELRESSPRIGRTRVIRFPPGRRERAWVGNAVAVGNASGFVEPLEATSLASICSESRALAELLSSTDLRVTDSVRRYYNRIDAAGWDDIRDFLGVHYRFNTRLDSAFWRACRATVDIGGARDVVDFYQDNGPALFGSNLFPGGSSIFGAEGYLTLLVGQQVPHRAPHPPGPEERTLWERLRARNRQEAVRGVGVADALREIRSEEWAWDPGFYRRKLSGGAYR